MVKTRLKIHLIVTVSLTLILCAPAAWAGGGFGSVWSKDSTPNSITLNWSNPGGNYRACGSSPRHRVCRKVANSWVDTCNNYEKNTENKPYTFKGLKADTFYKFKVYTLAEKKSFGKFRNCKHRKVGTVKIATQKKPAPLTHSLATVGAGDRSLSVRVRYSRPEELGAINVCYKKKWSTYSLEGNCPVPIFTHAVGKNFGYDNRTPPSMDFVVKFDDLSRCRPYKIVAYAFRKNQQGVFKIGETDGKTSGLCPFFGPFKWDDSSVVDALITDYDQTALIYLDQVNEFYGHPCFGLISHLQNAYPQFAEKTGTIDPDLLKETNLLDFLLEEQPEVLDSWQKQPELLQAGLNATSWVRDKAPQVYEELRNEVDDPDTGECPWTPWLNRDNPTGQGDFETLRNFVAAGQACQSPEAIQCQTLDGIDWREAGEAYTCRPPRGGVCINRSQDDGECQDYRVRFRCCSPTNS